MNDRKKLTHEFVLEFAKHVKAIFSSTSQLESHQEAEKHLQENPYELSFQSVKSQPTVKELAFGILLPYWNEDEDFCRSFYVLLEEHRWQVSTSGAWSEFWETSHGAPYPWPESPKLTELEGSIHKLLFDCQEGFHGFAVTELAIYLNKIDWGMFFPITNDFVVVGMDIYGNFKELHKSIPDEKRQLLDRRGLLGKDFRKEALNAFGLKADTEEFWPEDSVLIPENQCPKSNYPKVCQGGWEDVVCHLEKVCAKQLIVEVDSPGCLFDADRLSPYEEMGFNGSHFYRGYFPHSLLSRLPRSLERLALPRMKIGDAGVKALAAQCPNLRVLDIRDNDVGAVGAKAIASGMPSLVKLNIADNRLNQCAAEAIAELGHLVHLEISHNNLPTSAVDAIARKLSRLTSLCLIGNEIGDDGAAALAQHLPRLENLNLVGTSIGSSGISAIAEKLHDLKSLDVSWNKLGPASAKAIGKGCPRLTRLNASSVGFGTQGALSSLTQLHSLKHLDLYGNELGDEGAIAIASQFPDLESLSLGGNQLTDESARAIANEITQLRVLNISNNQIGESGGIALALGLGQIEELDISQNLIGDAGAIAIARNCSQLRVLDVSVMLGQSTVSAAAIRSIAERLTHLRRFCYTAFRLDEENSLAFVKEIRKLLPSAIVHS